MSRIHLHLPHHIHLPKLERRPELDALRGLFLVWMTLTHLPTRFSDFVNQPLGFVSSAEGFVFISALLVGRLYIRDLMQNPANVRVRLWKRSLKIYGYHLLMLALAFTVVAGFAAHTHKVALMNLLTFYFAHPFVAIAGSVLLLYLPAPARHPSDVRHFPLLHARHPTAAVRWGVEVDTGCKRADMAARTVWFARCCSQRPGANHTPSRPVAGDRRL